MLIVYCTVSSIDCNVGRKSNSLSEKNILAKKEDKTKECFSKK